jgi:hypothetical protein
MLYEIGYYSRMARGVWRYARAPRLADARSVVRENLEHRETHFLDLARRVVFSNPTNPYHAMFRIAGCGFEDLAEEVRRRGLEGALESIYRSGVYLTHEEFKGRTPIVRSGKHIPWDAESFANPLVAPVFETTSSGSGGPRTRTPLGIEVRLYREALHMLTRLEFALVGRPEVVLAPLLPSNWGLMFCLRVGRERPAMERWFTYGGRFREAWHYRVATHALVHLARLAGAPMPSPEYLPPDDFTPVAEYLARRRAAGQPCVVHGMVSAVVRIAMKAKEAGLDISGTFFRAGGEALTDAKREAVESTGSEITPSYVVSELGAVGVGCRRMRCGNSVHHFADSTAVIRQRVRAPLTDTDVDALLFTTLLPFSPRVLINADMGDCGVLEPANCDCIFAQIGFTTRVRDIWSYAKLTGQGMTLVGTDLVEMLEHDLPARFGGGPGDYQLVEREGPGQTEILLRVSPRVGLRSTTEVREYLLKRMRKFYGGALASRDWRHTQAMRVEIAEPLAGATGKVLPLHVLGGGTSGP